MDFENDVHFNASPNEVYELILDEKKHQEFSKGYVEIDRKIGGQCNWYNSMYGEIVELIQDKRIVHTWRGNDWPKDHYATVTINFEQDQEGTLIHFKLTNIPDKEPFKSVNWKAGWETAYWKPMREWLKDKEQQQETLLF